MAGRYAEKTNVSNELSRLEIERTLIKYGAENFIYASAPGKAMIGFTMNDRQIKFLVPLPRKDEFLLTPGRGQQRTEKSQMDAWEQAFRQRWRALLLVIKAKLEAVECGISEFESEFMANIVLPNGATAGEFLIPQIAKAYETQIMPPMLPMLGE